MNAHLITLHGKAGFTRSALTSDRVILSSSMVLTHPLDKHEEVAAFLQLVGNEWYIKPVNEHVVVEIGRPEKKSYHWERIHSPVPLAHWDQVKINNYFFLFVIGDVTIHNTAEYIALLDITPEINASLVFARVSPIRRFLLFALKRLSTINISIQAIGFDGWEYQTGGLNKHESVYYEQFLRADLNAFRVDPRYRPYGPSTEHIRLEITGKGRQRVDIPVKILPITAWLQSEQRVSGLSLASFVYPNHPYITDLIKENAISWVDVKEGAIESVMAGLHAALSTHYAVLYQGDPSNGWGAFLQHWQRIRMPEEVLGSGSEIPGGGTCIDLALVFASALEQIKLQPLIALIRQSETRQWHAVVGVWSGRYQRITSVYNSYPRTRESIIWVDPISVTRQMAQPYDEARITAENMVRNEEDLIYIVDVFAARREGMVTLPFDPIASACVERVLDISKKLAIHNGTQAVTAHFIYGLLETRSQTFLRLLEEKDSFDFQAVIDNVQNLLARLPLNRTKYITTTSFESVYSNAFDIALQEGSSVVEDKHLIYALTNAQSGSVEKICEKSGIQLAHVRKSIKSQIGRHSDLYEIPSE